MISLNDSTSSRSSTSAMTSSTRTSHRYHRKYKGSKQATSSVSSIVCIDPVTKEVRTPLPLIKDVSKPTIASRGNIRVDKSQESFVSGQLSPTTMVLQILVYY